jgi:hypothetical protein
MTVEPTIPLGTILHALVIIAAMAVGWGSLRAQLKEITRRLGCAEEVVDENTKAGQSISERLRSVEKDVEWIKGELNDGRK